MLLFHRIVLIFLIGNFFSVNISTVSANSESDDTCAALSFSNSNKDSSKLSKFQLPNGKQQPNRTTWNELASPNSTIYNIEIANGCDFRMCFYSREYQIHKCKESNNSENFSSGFDDKNWKTWDGLKGSIVGLDCSCQKKPEGMCNNNCENVQIFENDKHHCANLYIDENCSDCRFERIPLYMGIRYKTNNLSVISSIIVRDNCTVSSESRDYLGEVVHWDFFPNDTKTNQWITEKRQEYDYFNCFCKDADDYPKTIFNPANSTSFSSRFWVVKNNESHDTTQITLFVILGVGALLTILISIMLIDRCYEKSKRMKHIYSLLEKLDSKYRIKEGDVVIDYNTILGEGRFGKVYLGFMNSRNCKVAVKKIRSYSIESNYLKTLAREIETLSILGYDPDHPNDIIDIPNVISMIGAYMNPDKDILLVLELCDNGSLEQFLESHKSRFLRNIPMEQMEGYSRYDIDSSGDEDETNKPQFTNDDFSLRKLVEWAYQIASGMEYISSKGILHLDLGIRNILLDLKLVAKVGDLGLSKVLVDSDYYRILFDQNLLLPLRQMSIEAIDTFEFSVKTDVWAFGICLWELFSLGATPYPDITCQLDLKRKLVDEGYRLEKPPICPDDIYEQIIKCWDEDPSQRPDFTALKMFFNNYLRRPEFSSSSRVVMGDDS